MAPHNSLWFLYAPLFTSSFGDGPSTCQLLSSIDKTRSLNTNIFSALVVDLKPWLHAAIFSSEVLSDLLGHVRRHVGRRVRVPHPKFWWASFGRQAKNLVKEIRQNERAHFVRFPHKRFFKPRRFWRFRTTYRTSKSVRVATAWTALFSDVVESCEYWLF